MFDTTKQDLKDILRDIDQGKLQLPDFQRDYVWGDEDVRSLIASVAKGFPIGALLSLETGGVVHFKPRLLAGVAPKEVSPSTLLLDGQQRLTSLYQAAFARSPVRTRTSRGTEIERFYYLDIKKAVDSTADLDEAIIGLPADRLLRSNFGKTVDLDVSSAFSEFEHDLFPLNQVFDSKAWFYGWRDYWKARGREIIGLDSSFDQGVLECIQRYEMPIIRLDKNNSREAICLVFEKVNVGGKKLDAFELVTAIYASDAFDLREDWNGSQNPVTVGRRARMIGSPNRRDVISQIASTDFLQACTLLHTRENRLAKAAEGVEGKDLPQITCRRDAVLALPLSGYKKHAGGVESGFVEAATFLNEQKIIWNKDVPYPPATVALASVFAISGRDAKSAAAKQKLAQWFWAVTLGELYASSVESRMARDVPELVAWIDGGATKPQSLDEALFQRDRLLSLRSRASAAYKGIHALLMRHGCRDFITEKGVEIMTFYNDNIDIHHIFPQDWCKKHGINADLYNSIVNKTALSKSSNVAIGGDAPSVYLKRIEEKYGISPADMDTILLTHLIDPAYLRADDFTAFFNARLAALTPLISAAMGKPVIDEHGSNEQEMEVQPDPDDELAEEVA